MTDRRILFYSKAPMNYAVFRPVAERLRGEAGIRLDVLARDEVRSLAAEHEALGVPRSALIGGWRARWTRYDLYISADIQLVGKRARRKAHVFHGISFKGKAYTENIRKYDRAFLIGPYQRRRFVELGLLEADDPRMVDVGMPRTDAIVNGAYGREAVLAGLGLDPGKPVVLYAPTWRKESSLNTSGERIIEAIGAMEDVSLVVKVHDLCLDSRINVRDWGAWFREREAAGVTWKFFKGHDITPLLAVADLLVSDASSTANEFLLRDRPIVFIDAPELLRKYGSSIDLDTWGRKTGRVAASPEELPELIRGELGAPEGLSSVRREACADYFYHPGRATDRSVEEIHRLLES